MTTTDTPLGISLKERRVALGLSIDEAATTTRIRKEYLVALEADDYTQLPGPAYITGFLRNYADFLELDANQLVTTCLARRQQSSPSDEPQLVVKKEASRSGVHLGVVVLTGLLLIGYWMTTTPPDRPQPEPSPAPAVTELPSTQKTTAPPLASKPPAISPEPEPELPAVLQIPFKRRAILELTAKGATTVALKIDGRTEQRYAVTSGTQLRWKISATAEITVTESDQINLRLNQEPLHLTDHRKIILTRTLEH